MLAALSDAAGSGSQPPFAIVSVGGLVAALSFGDLRESQTQQHPKGRSPEAVGRSVEAFNENPLFDQHALRCRVISPSYKCLEQPVPPR